jgi:hypothetical protein
VAAPVAIAMPVPAVMPALVAVPIRVTVDDDRATIGLPSAFAPPETLSERARPTYKHTKNTKMLRVAAFAERSSAQCWRVPRRSFHVLEIFVYLALRSFFLLRVFAGNAFSGP